MSAISRFFQIVFGFIIGIAILASAGAAAAYYFITRLTDTPPRPVFSEELPKKEAPSAAKLEPNAAKSPAEAKPQEQESPEKPPEPEKLEPGAYKARVTWPQGLSVRGEPSLEGERVGGVAFNAELIVIKDSENGKWQQIRTPDGSAKGWVKAGNVKKIDGE